MKKLLSVLLAMIMILSLSMAAAEPAADEAPSLLGSVRIGMNGEEVLAAEPSEPRYDNMVTETTRDIEFYDCEFAGLKAYHAYVLMDDRLVMFGVYGFPENTPEELAAIKEAMAAEYGEAGEVSTDTITALFTKLGGGQTPFTFSDASQWVVAENTLAWAFMVHSDDRMMCYVVYVDPACLE